MRMIGSDAGIGEVTEHLQSLAHNSRIVAEPRVVVGSNIVETLQSESKDAAIVIIGFETPEENGEAEFFNRMEELTDGLSRVVFVRSHGDAALES